MGTVEETARTNGPIVHQQGLSVHDKILREFDLSSQYGVSEPMHGSECS